MNKVLLTIGLAFSLLIAGCGGPTIDTATQKTFKESIEKISQSLDVEERQEFRGAIKYIMGNAMKRSFMGGANMTAELEKKIDGQTADGVIALAEEMKKEVALTKIEKFKEIKKKSAEDAEVLKDIETKDPKIVEITNRYRPDISTIRGQVEVVNNLDETIHSVYFRLRAKGSKEWSSAVFQSSLIRGLKSGESKKALLKPQMGVDWDDVPVGPGDDIELKAVMAKKEYGQTLYNADAFEQVREEMEELQAKYGK